MDLCTAQPLQPIMGHHAPASLPSPFSQYIPAVSHKKRCIVLIKKTKGGIFMICPHCNAAISDDSAFCSACGKRLEQSEEQVLPGDSVVCPGCGSVNSSGANFCTNCRAPLSKTALEQVKTQNDLQLQQAQVKQWLPKDFQPYYLNFHLKNR